MQQIETTCASFVTGDSFAAILADGSVVTWGNPFSGGDSSAIQDQLWNVQQIQSTRLAFAAILANGSVVTWGYPDFGGDSNQVQAQLLQNVHQIQATNCSVAAILEDASVDFCGQLGPWTLWW